MAANLSTSTANLPAHAEIVVIGAGLAGLAAANALTAAGRTPLVIEASDGVGGRVRTDIVDGYRLDRGFQILLTGYPEVQRQLDLDALDLQPFRPGATVWIDGKGATVGDPFRDPKSLIATVLSPIGSPADKLRILKLRRRVCSGDPRRLLRNPERTTAEHLNELGFSTKMIERFFQPLFAGIQLDPSLGTSSRMFDIIFRSLSIGDAVVPADGMGAIGAQMASRLEAGSLHLNTRVTALATAGSGRARSITTDRGVITADQVVVATDGPAATKLLGLKTTDSLSVGCVWFGADRSPVPNRTIILDGQGTGPAANVAILSDVAPSYAPPGKTLIAAATPGLIGAEIDESVRSQMRLWFGSQVDSWATLRVDRIVHAQPAQNPPSHAKRRVRLDHNLWVCGDHRDTGSIQGALFSGRRTAQALVSNAG